MVKTLEIKKNCDYQIDSLLTEETLLTKGSESFLFRSTFLGQDCIIKERRPKAYRLKVIDEEIRLSRMRLESRLIKTLLKRNMNVPSLLGVDYGNKRLILQFIEGELFSKKINETQLHFKVGQFVASLHNMDIIHSDLTPLNIIVTNKNEVYLIDFGLAYFSDELKDKVMDLFIYAGSLKLYNATSNFKEFLEGYSELTEHGKFKQITDELEILSQKGRYKKS